MKLRFEGYPHYNYPKEPLNFFNSLLLVRLVIEKGEECFCKLCESFPQHSLLLLLSLKCSMWEKFYDILLDEKEVMVGKIEDRELFDDETTMMQTLSSFSESVV